MVHLSRSCSDKLSKNDLTELNRVLISLRDRMPDILPLDHKDDHLSDVGCVVGTARLTIN